MKKEDNSPENIAHIKGLIEHCNRRIEILEGLDLHSLAKIHKGEKKLLMERLNRINNEKAS